jgi:hypothetical protein
MVYIGTLEKVANLVPKINIWCENKLGWIDAISSISSTDQGVERK